MAKVRVGSQTKVGWSIPEMFAANDHLNQIVLQDLDQAAWRAKPPGGIRSIAAVFSHMHNVRCKWVRLNARHLRVPSQLNRAHCSIEATRLALAESAARCTEMLEETLGEQPTIKIFCADAWGLPLTAGVEMLCYMLCHEAHHRGQACMIAHQLGFMLSKKITGSLWNWSKLRSELPVQVSSSLRLRKN